MGIIWKTENITDCEQTVRNQIAKLNKVNFYSIIAAVAFFLLAIIELSFMDFFTTEFTLTFICISGSLVLGASICWAVSRRKLKSLEERLMELKTKNGEPTINAEFTESEIKWNKLWDLYGNGKRDNPIFYLCDYESGINGEGHFGFLFNTENTQENDLKTYISELQKVLPKDLYDNFNKAYQIWLQGDDEQSEKACHVADEYFYQNEDKIIEILQQYANTLEM